MAETGFEPRAHTVIWQFMIPQCVGILALVVCVCFKKTKLLICSPEFLNLNPWVGALGKSGLEWLHGLALMHGLG